MSNRLVTLSPHAVLPLRGIAMNKKNISFFMVLLLLLSLASGCIASQADPMLSTLTPLSAAVAGTATAQTANVGGEANQLATAFAKATAQSADIYATETARASLSSASKMATATVIAPVVAELPRYNINLGQGYVAWVHNPVSIDLNGYQQSGYANDYPLVTAKDFVMAADINWYTHNSLSACGFMFRSNGNSNKPSQYMVVITRFSTGYVAFTATVNGEMSNMRTFYPSQQDNSFTWLNNATNRLAIVVRGALIDVYTNGVLIGEIDTTQPPPDSMQSPPSLEIPKNSTPQQLQDYQNLMDQNNQNMSLVQSQMAGARMNFAKNKPIFSEGMLGFVNVSQSGESKCTFSNAWLFQIER
jgi:hypothetical protein